MSIANSTGKGKVSSGYIPTLDGWRTLSIAIVILAHAARWFPSLNPAVSDAASGYAVELFFALSGFLICNRLMAEESATGTVSLGGFYIRRFFRLQPAAYVYLATLAVLTLFAIIPLNWGSTVAAALAFRNLVPEHGESSWYTAHFWSLAAEEHFYFLFPALFLLVRKHRLWFWAVVTVALDGWSIVAERMGVFHLRRTDFVVSAMTVGVVAALLFAMPAIRRIAQKVFHPVVGISIAILLFVLFLRHNASYSHALLQCALPMLFVSTLLRPSSPISRLLELPPIRFVGRISYSLYLWQQLFFHSIYTSPASLRANGWFYLAGTFATATASYFFIEKPSIRYGHGLAKRFAVN